MTAEPESLARAAYERGDFEEAAAFFRAAREQAADPVGAAEIDNSLSVALLQSGDPYGALEAVQDTPAVFAELGDARREAIAHGNHAAALEACGKTAEAEAAYRRAADLFEQVGDDENRTHTLAALSKLQLSDNRPLEAAATMSAGVSDGSPGGIRGKILRALFRIQSRLLGT